MLKLYHTMISKFWLCCMRYMSAPQLLCGRVQQYMGLLTIPQRTHRTSQKHSLALLTCVQKAYVQPNRFELQYLHITKRHALLCVYIPKYVHEF